jgi:hypothetical protein
MTSSAVSKRLDFSQRCAGPRATSPSSPPTLQADLQELLILEGHSRTLGQPRLSYAGEMGSPTDLSIELAPEVSEEVCPDCGRSFSSVRGFLYDHRDAYAVYHALLQTEHPSSVADIALSFGRWDEDSTGDERSRVGLRVWPDGDELKMHITDPSESAWGNSDTFGRMLPRGEVLDTDRQDEALRAVEFVIAHDPRLADHLK